MNNLTVMVAGACAFVEQAGTSSSSGSRCPLSLSGMQAKVVVVCKRNKESVTCAHNGIDLACANSIWWCCICICWCI